MNPGITKDSIGVLHVNHKGVLSQWEVQDMNVDSENENIQFVLVSAGREDVNFTTDRHGFNDSLAVVRGYLKRAIEDELEVRGGDAAVS